MADMQGQSQLVLAQNQYALIQDTTKGVVQVYAGPHSGTVSQNEQPVTYDRNKDTYVRASLQEAVKQNPLVGEGDYLVLENPLLDDKGNPKAPGKGGNPLAELRIGSKINIPGPTTFPLWPGQVASAIPGHHLRLNQYLVVRVYNVDEATKNASENLKSKASGEDGSFTPGQLLVIKGTEVSFFIPPTGFEVLKDSDSEKSDKYVREALTLERLEYAILLDDDGNKRFEIGPLVVFPEATETFVRKDNTRKFKAIELNDQMGVYVKVTADYTDEDGTKHLAGEELFISGKERRFYYPRAEHALIGYDDPKEGIKRERYYGITIPKGEGRYVLDKTAGDIKKVEGPQIFVPDPRNEVIVRRVLDAKTVALWYPTSVDAAAFNESLRSLTDDSTSFLAESAVLSAAADVTRGVNRGLKGSKAFSEPVGSSYEGDRLSRGTKYTPPPTLTLNSKYDGIPSISVWTGYAVQVVNKSGDRRVIVGPDTVLLEYDETLEMLELSTGKPKNTDTLHRDVYLRVDNNLVSDIVRVESQDLVAIDLKLSYRVNFLREHQDKWFSIENYVKYLCDHMRSILKGSLKKYGVQEIQATSAKLIRDIVLGDKNGTESRHHFFAENGMDVYDVEVLSVVPEQRIAELLKTTNLKAVETAISLASEEQILASTRRKLEIEQEIAELTANVAIAKKEMEMLVSEASAKAIMADIEAKIAQEAARLDAQVEQQEQHNAVATAEFNRVKQTSDYDMTLREAEVALFEKKMAAIAPNLIQAMQTLGDTETVNRLTEAVAPLAIVEQTSTSAILERLFKGTAMETVIQNAKSRTSARAATAK